MSADFPKKELEFIKVNFCAFTNTNCNELYIDHAYNGTTKTNRRVPAKLFVKQQKHKDLLLELHRMAPIEIQFSYDTETLQDTLTAIRKV